MGKGVIGRNIKYINFQGILFSTLILLAFICVQPALILKGERTIIKAIIPVVVALLVDLVNVYLYVKDRNHKAIRWVVFMFLAGGYSYIVLNTKTTSGILVIYPISLVFLFYMDKALSIVLSIFSVLWSAYGSFVLNVQGDSISNNIAFGVSIVFFIGLIAVTYGINSMKADVDLNLNKVSEKNKEQIKLIERVKNVCEIIDKESNNLNELVTTIDESSRGVNSAVDDITIGATTTAEEMQNGSNLIGEIKNVIVDAKTTTEGVNESFNLTNEVVLEGQAVVSQLANKTEEFISRNSNVEKSMNKLKEKNSEIINIIELISKIAEQTNLLSLNASIEAARVGELGKGFGVVADEIKKLSVATKENSQEISRILMELTNETDNSVEEVKILVEEGLRQKELVSNTEESFAKIKANMVNVKSGVEIVSNKMDNVNSISENVSSVIENLVSITEDSMANIEEVNAMSSENMRVANEGKNLANNLKDTVIKLGNALE